LKKNIAILGSTGSIGTQALEVVKNYNKLFSVEVLTANNSSDLLIKQAIEFAPNFVIISDETKYDEVKKALESSPIKVFAGEESISQIVEYDSIDIVLNALVGYAGFKPTIKALESGKDVALANKESIVVGGELVTKIAKEKGANIYPVDSEHSAVFQCLAGEFHNPVEKIILTASGGPFRNKTIQEMEMATKEDALNHPVWNMGNKITIDSATLMNKGLEIIEAHWLFGVKPEQIEVIIHPQSIIHSLVQFTDGSIKAQMGLPDMKLPIQYAITYPQRLNTNFKRFSFTDFPELTFIPPDYNKFKALPLAYKALEEKGNMTCILNAANEVAVDAFLNDKIKFLAILDIIEKCMVNMPHIKNPGFNDYVETNKETRTFAQNLINKK